MTVFVVVWSSPDGTQHAFANDLGQLVTCATPLAAFLLVARLAKLSIAATVIEVMPGSVTDLLMAETIDGVDAEDRVVLIEAQTTGAADLEAWAAETVERALPAMQRKVAAALTFNEDSA